MSLDELARLELSGPAEREAVRYEGRWHNWGELRVVADLVRDLLAKAGLDPRAPIGFAPRNRPSAIAAEIGLIADRRTIRMIYAFQSPAGLARDIGRLK